MSSLRISRLLKSTIAPSITSRLHSFAGSNTQFVYPCYKAAVRRYASESESGKEYPKTFDKILIANRGEIACRVMRTAKKMGIKTVAVYSDADANAQHVQMADEAYHVGPSPTSKSYLVIPNIIKAVKETGAQAVHPGYGFLSENFHFVQALDEAGVAFIGPNENSMAMLGDKIQSKIIAKDAGVHTIPGFKGEVKDVNHALSIANEIGYPVMIKASAGGGGKGMRIAWSDKEVKENFQLIKNESMSSFGDDRLLIEKFIDNPRHIEIQVVGDKMGNVVYLPERECSIQRRNQKVIEEAPSVHLDEKTRRAMGEQAVSLAKKVGYYSAGTVEFLVDPQRNFYFLEMNTRLQVEHPITELITGFDLVEQMIRVAANQPLSFRQPDVKINGWAVESRVYAEDPEKYLPSIGNLSYYDEPTTEKVLGVGKKGIVRCDSGVEEGSEISIYYDPMICKLSTWGETRHDALKIMEKALDSYVIKGVTHNLPLLRDVISHPRFQKGALSTKFLAEEYPKGFKGHKLTSQTLSQLLSVSSVLHHKRQVRDRTFLNLPSSSLTPPSITSESEFFLTVSPSYLKPSVDDPPKQSHHVKLRVQQKENGKEEYFVSVNDGKFEKVEIDWPVENALVQAWIGDVEKNLENEMVLQYVEDISLGLRMQHYGTKFDVKILTPEQQRLSKYIIEKPPQDLTKFLLSPMPGSVVSISVKPGDTVAEGTELAVVEAMKMQNVLKAPKAGVVKKVLVQAGNSVAADEVILEFEDEKKPNNNNGKDKK